MKDKVVFITGTDTDVGKTVFTASLGAHLHRRGVSVAALKPVASGGREDAMALHKTVPNGLALDDINPWHFAAPVAPPIAARQEGCHVKLGDVVDHILQVSSRFETTLVEAAGGLLSPMGAGFDCRDLMVRLEAAPWIVCPDRLGAVNQARLAWEAVPKRLRSRAVVVLMEEASGACPELGNIELIGEFIPQAMVISFPWLGRNWQRPSKARHLLVEKSLGGLLAGTL